MPAAPYVSPRLSVRGELDMATVPRLVSMLEAEERGAPPKIDLDLSELEFIDVTGMRVLLEAAERAESQHRGFRVLNPQPAVRRLFALAAIDDTVEVAFE